MPLRFQLKEVISSLNTRKPLERAQAHLDDVCVANLVLAPFAPVSNATSFSGSDAERSEQIAVS